MTIYTHAGPCIVRVWGGIRCQWTDRPATAVTVSEASDPWETRLHVSWDLPREPRQRRTRYESLTVKLDGGSGVRVLIGGNVAYDTTAEYPIFASMEAATAANERHWDLQLQRTRGELSDADHRRLFGELVKEYSG